jgi:hypothetical protein
LPDRILTLRELNRTTLARQMLLRRESMPIPAAIERLVGMQAQLSSAPFIGLWTRLVDFKREDLGRWIDDHAVVKATMMRATLHLVTADDFLRFRTTLQPVLSGASESITKQRGTDTFDYDAVIAAAKAFIAAEPRTFAEISAMLSERWPDVDIGSMRYTVRTTLPMVQVPVSGGWSFPGHPKFTLAETWLDQPFSAKENVKMLLFRYLAAFGPASVTDAQKWSGFPKLKDAFETLRPELVTVRDERKRELFDLPDMPYPDSPAPERFLPEFDNLLLAHDKRTRIVADEYRKKVYLPGLRVAATFLVDGFVRGAWKVESKKKIATLTLEPFEPLTKQNRAALAEEAEKLARFVEPEAKTFEIKFAD